MSENLGTIYYVVEADTEKLLSSVNPVDKSLDGLNKTFGKTDKASKKTEHSLNSLSQQIKNIGKDSSTLDMKIITLTKSLMGLGVAKTSLVLAQMGESYREMAERIKMATSSQAEYEEVQQRLLATANGTYRSLAEAQEVYIQTSIGLRDMGYSTNEALDIVDSLSYSFVKNATSTDKAASALNALTRAVNRGTVLTDHWASLLLAVPTILEDIAEVSGMTTQEISKLGYEGKLSAELLTEGLKNSVNENKAAADDMATTIADAFTNFRNNLSVYVGESEGAIASTKLFVGAIEALGNNIDLIAKALTIAGAGALANYVTRLTFLIIEKGKAAISTRLLALEEIKLARTHAAATAAALAQAQANASLGGSAAAVTKATIAHEAAVKRLTVAQAGYTSVARGVVGVLGGPVGIAAMLAVAAASFIDFSGSARVAATDLDKLAESVENLTAKQIENEQLNLKVSINELQKEIKKLEKDIVAKTIALESSQKAFKMTEEAVDKAKAEISNMSQELDDSHQELQRSIELQGRLANQAAILAGELGSAAAAQHGLNNALSGGDTAIGKAIARMQGALTGILDDTYVKRAERQLQQLKDAGEDFTEADVEALMSSARAADAAAAARRKSTAATKASGSAIKSETKDLEANKRVIDNLNNSLYETSLAAEELAIHRAVQQLNPFATAEEVAQVEALAAALFKATEEQKRRQEFGTGKKADEYIFGSTSPLSGGAFDDQYARYEAEAVAEQERYAAQLERLKEARELQIETQRSYNELEEQAAAEHAARMEQIEQAKNQVLLSGASNAFGALAGVMKESLGEQSGIYKAMFAASKAFAIAESIVNIQAAIAKAANSAPWPANLGAIASVAAATAGLVSTITSTTMGSGRQYGGSVAPNSMHRINEDGKPEILNMANGRQYLLPNSRGEVVSNKDATSGSSAPNVIVNIHNAPEGTEVHGRQVDDEYILDVMIRDVASEGRFTRAGREMLGWQRQGR